jgi:hypothetical protein
VDQQGQSLPASELPAGRFDVVDLLSGQAAPPLSVGPGGALGEYAPTPILGPRQAQVLQLTAHR